jgi:hypothetical protein
VVKREGLLWRNTVPAGRQEFRMTKERRIGKVFFCYSDPLASGEESKHIDYKPNICPNLVGCIILKLI